MSRSVSKWTSERLCRVVVNDAGTFAIYPVSLAVPDGWDSTQFTGVEADCVDYVDRMCGGRPEGA